MQKKTQLYLFCASILMLLVVLNCSNFDESTSLGKDVITDIDSSLINFSDNFISYVWDSSEAVSNSQSIPSANDSLFGVHTDLIAVGTLNSETASGYTHFVIDSAISQNYKSGEVLESLTVFFDVLSLPNTVSSDSTGKLFLYQTTEDEIFKPRQRPSGTALDTITKVTDDNYTYAAKITDSSLLDSITHSYDTIFKACSIYYETLKSCTTSACSTTAEEKLVDPRTFRFSIFGDGDGLIRFSNTPKFLLHFKRDSISVTDTVWAYYSNYVASQDNIDSLSALALSSYSTERTAVFSINLSPLWDELETASKNSDKAFILSANVIEQGQITETEASDSAIYFSYYFSTDPLISDGFVADSLLSTIYEIDDKDSIVISISSKIKELSRAEKPDTGYLYLKLRSLSLSSYIDPKISWKKVLWSKPQFRAVISTLNR